MNAILKKRVPASKRDTNLGHSPRTRWRDSLAQGVMMWLKNVFNYFGGRASTLPQRGQFVKNTQSILAIGCMTMVLSNIVFGYEEYALNVPNPDATDLGVLYITNTSSDTTISPIYGSLYVKGTALFENEDLLDGGSLGPLETKRFTSADLSNIAGTWGGRAILKLACSASNCSPDVLKVMMTGRQIGGGPLVDLTPKVPEIREGEQGIFTILGIPPEEGEDAFSIRINNVSAGTITVKVDMYDGYGAVIGTRDYSIEPKDFVRLTHTDSENQWAKDLPGDWNDVNAWLQVVTDTPAGVTRVQYFMRDKTTGTLSNLSVGGQQDDIDASNPNNPDNPMDWVGQAHNQGVQFVLETVDIASVDSTVIRKSVAEYFQVDVESIPKYQDISSDELIKNLLGKSIISNTGAEFLRKLFGIIDTHGSKSLSGFLQEVKTLEALASRTIKGRELGMFYASASVARYSGKLWAESKVNVGEIVKADVGGFVSGYMEGGIWTGVKKGIAASVKELVQQLFKKLL